MKNLAGAFGNDGEFHLNINTVQLIETFKNKLIPTEITRGVSAFS